MCQPESTTDQQLSEWASRQLSDYDAHDPGTLFAEGILLSVKQAYALQSAVADLRRQRGEQVIGYKVGCTSSTIRAQLGIDHCISGRLYDTEQRESGAELSRSDFANLAIEGELAIELSREPVDSDFSDGGMPTCVRRVFPVIELHHHISRGPQPTASELIANNAIHAGFVGGCGVSPDQVRSEPSLSILADDALLDECSGPSLVANIRDSLQWLNTFVQQRSDRLRAGHIILTGSIPRLIPIERPCRVQVDAPPFGAVEATIV